MDSFGSLGSGRPFPALPGLPGSSTDLSLRAVPKHPGRPGGCICSLLPPPMSGFITFGRLATSMRVTRPNRVRLRYGPQVCLPGFHQTDYSIPLRFGYTYERAIYMVNSFQLTRSARLILVFRRLQETSTRTDSCNCKLSMSCGKAGSIPKGNYEPRQRFIAVCGGETGCEG